MKKFKKIALIVLFSLLVACGIAYLVLFCLYKNQTVQITYQVIDYICNKPLPVIGVSILTVGLILYKVISVIVSSKGKKYSELKDEIAKLYEELKKVGEENEHLKEVIYNETEKAINFTQEVVDALPNKKVKLIGEKYGKERENSDTETKDL